jgi:hypothetical protein
VLKWVIRATRPDPKKSDSVVKLISCMVVGLG